MILQPRLTELKNWILKYNKYFDEAFDNVELSEERGIVHNGDKAVFPADNFGSYFYLRMPSTMTPLYAEQYKIADNWLSVGISADINLIAYMADADPDKLLANLLATVGRFGENTVIKKLLLHSEDVIMQELSRISPDNAAKALQNQNERKAALVGITFSIQFPYSFPELNCITNPCRTC